MKEGINSNTKKQHTWQISLAKTEANVKNGLPQYIVDTYYCHIVLVDSLEVVDDILVDPFFLQDFKNPLHGQIVKTTFEIQVQEASIELVFIDMKDGVSSLIYPMLNSLVISSAELGG